MFERDYDQFAKLMDQAYALHMKTLPLEAKMIFFKAMEPYPLEVVSRALTATIRDPQRGQYPPKPADLIAQIQGVAGDDGRPGAEEAWAIALTSRDESDTVVWTQETAEAFAICSPIMELGDEVGARMAFKEAYQRLTSQSRNANIPVQWSASLGWNLERRTTVLTKAATAGLLAAPVVAGLLPPPAATAQGEDDNARVQLDKIRKMMADMNTEKQRESELHAQRERGATAAAKQRANDLVKQHQAAA